MSDQLDLKKQLVDQSSHMLAAAVILSPVIAAPSLFTAVLAGLGLGIVREVTEGGTKVNLESIKGAFTPWSCVDIAFWGIGGALAWTFWN